MSDNFIPLNQSTPVQNRWQQDKGQQQQRFNNRQHSGKWRGGGNNNWNNSRNSSYGAIKSHHENQASHSTLLVKKYTGWQEHRSQPVTMDSSNSSNNSYSHERHNIDAYLHPSMLQDPWASLRQYNASRHSSST